MESLLQNSRCLAEEVKEVDTATKAATTASRATLDRVALAPTIPWNPENWRSGSSKKIEVEMMLDWIEYEISSPSILNALNLVN